MQILRVKAWEIWSRAVTSGRQRVDTQGDRGQCLMKDLEALSFTISPKAGSQSVSKAVSILFVVLRARDNLTQNRNYYCCPPSLLPRVSA